jgi:hypothetical protein
VNVNSGNASASGGSAATQNMKISLFIALLALSAIAYGVGSEILTYRRTVPTSAVLVAAFDSGRESILIRNLDTTISIYVGVSTVTTSGATGGMRIKAGERFSLADWK